MEWDNRSDMWGSRTRLPAVMPQKGDLSVWTFLKQCIGKELSKISMPIHFNEPLSFLQRLTEYTEYADLIDMADKEPDIVRRLEYVTAFAVSASASNWDRYGKPFNPLLCETYEYHGKGYRMVTEQVSHHPPVSAFHAEGKHFRFYGCIYPKLRFWGKSVEINPRGKLTLELLNHQEVYEWRYVNCFVHNIIVGSLWVEHSGNMEVWNKTAGYCAKLVWHPSGWFSSAQLHKIDGFIYAPDEVTRLRKVYGMWTQGLFSADVPIEENNVKHNWKTKDSNGEGKRTQKENMTSSELDDILTCNLNLPGQRLLWRASPRLPYAKDYYNFTTFAMHLNEDKPELLSALADPQNPDTGSFLPPTDSRFRSDMRLMEQGKIQEAADEKHRLEVKQREAKKRWEEAIRVASGKSPRHSIRGSFSAPSLFLKPSSDPQNEGSTSSKNSTTKSLDADFSLYNDPLWFTPGPENDDKNQFYDWLFTGDYWERNWSRCPNLY